MQTIYLQGGLHGIPYGVYPRLFLIWLTTQAVRTKHPVISLGRSFREHCRALGVPYIAGKRGTARTLQVQIERLLQCRIIREKITTPINLPADISNPEKAIFEQTENLTLASHTESLWRRSENNDWTCNRYTLILSDEFLKELINYAIPLRRSAIDALKRSPLATDIYQWLASRFFTLTERAFPSWAQLANQFGSDYKDARKFRRKFIDAVARVRAVYPEANCEPTCDGLILYPSDTPVARIQNTGFSLHNAQKKTL